MAPENQFKSFYHTSLTNIPTLIRWDDTEKRLVEGQLLDENALKWILE
jgi:hypothetical protein